MPTVASCAHLFLGGYDISGVSNMFSVNASSETQDCTVFGQNTRTYKGGLFTDTVSLGGFLDVATSGIEPILFGNRNVSGTPVTIFPHGLPATDSTNETGYGIATAQGAIQLGGGQIGTMLPYTAEFQPDSGKLVRAILIENFLSTVATTTIMSGASFQITHCSTDEKLYAGLHVTALSTALGASLTALIQAASSSGFATSNTRATFTVLSCKAGTTVTPVAASALSTDQPWFRTRLIVSTGSSTGATANGIVWMTVA